MLDFYFKTDTLFEQQGSIYLKQSNKSQPLVARQDVEGLVTMEYDHNDLERGGAERNVSA